MIKQIGSKIREYRKRKRYSQKDIAKLLNVSKAYISSFENGRRNPSIKTLERILNVLDVDIFDFFNKDLKDEYKYSNYHEYFIKKIFKNNEKWYLSNSGLWNERYMEEMQGLLTEKRNRREVNIIKRYIKGKNKKILDVPCGYGRISNLLTKKGYHVTGIDINDYFINIAKSEAKKQRLKIKYLVKDIFTFKNKYDIVLNIFTSLGYFESEEKNELFIEKLCDFVKPKGILILETINPIGVLREYKSNDEIMTKNGTRISYERFFDYRTSTNIERITYKYPAGKDFKGLHCIRLYYPHELIKICKKHGLKNIDILDENGKRKNILNSKRIWLIFKK